MKLQVLGFCMNNLEKGSKEYLFKYLKEKIKTLLKEDIIIALLKVIIITL